MTTRHEFTLNNPGALIAAVPAVLGFVPEHSLVVVGIDRGEMGAVMRMDLTDVMSGGLDDVVDVVASGCADAVIAVVADVDGAGCPMCNEDYRQLCAELGARLADQGVELLDVHIVDRIGKGGRWHCVDGCGESGPVDDPATSPLTAAAVLEGRRLYTDRAELEAVINADPAREGEVITQAVAELAAGCSATIERDRNEFRRAALSDVIAAAGRVAEGQILTDIEVATLAHGLTDLIVRDTVYALALGNSAPAAEELWLQLARALPSPWRAEALTLVAFFAYARGDGPLAGVALAAALSTDPTHRMADLLDRALQSGMRPEKIRQLAMTGVRLADELGVSLPGLEPGDRGPVRPFQPSRRGPSRAGGRRSRGLESR